MPPRCLCPEACPSLLWTALRCLQGPDQPPHAAQLVLREFLNPRQWKPPEDRTFALDAEQISALCDEAERIFRDEPSVLRLRGERPAMPANCPPCASPMLASHEDWPGVLNGQAGSRGLNKAHLALLGAAPDPVARVRAQRP